MDIFNHLFVTFLPYFCILSLATIALIISERAGIVNIGINGVIVMGATFYMIFANVFSDGGSRTLNGGYQILLFIFAALGGILFNLLHGFATIKLKANQIISGVAINILAPAITIAILFIFGVAQKLPFDVNELAVGNAATYEASNIVSLKVLLTLVIIVIAGVFFKYTRWGLRFKSVGENPQAADVAGINVNKVKWLAIILSGALAGIAGAVYISSLSSGNTFKGNVEGLGYLAIAIMIFGRWNVTSSIVSAFIFSILFSFGYHYKLIFPEQSDAAVSLIKMTPYLITLLALILFSKPVANKIVSMVQTSGPKAAGEPYDKSKR